MGRPGVAHQGRPGVFAPKRRGVALSSNDGCIIARSQAVKKAGVPIRAGIGPTNPLAKGADERAKGRDGRYVCPTGDALAASGVAGERGWTIRMCPSSLYVGPTRASDLHGLCEDQWRSPGRGQLAPRIHEATRRRPLMERCKRFREGGSASRPRHRAEIGRAGSRSGSTPSPRLFRCRPGALDPERPTRTGNADSGRTR